MAKTKKKLLSKKTRELLIKWGKNFLKFVVFPTVIAVLVAAQTGDIGIVKGALLGTGIGSLLDFTRKANEALK